MVVTVGTETSGFNSADDGKFAFVEWSTWKKRAADADTNPGYWELEMVSSSDGNGGVSYYYLPSKANEEKATANVYQTIDGSSASGPAPAWANGDWSGIPAGAGDGLPGTTKNTVEVDSTTTYHADGSVTATSDQTVVDLEDFSYQILSGAAAGQAVREGLTGGGQAVRKSGWADGLDDSVETVSRRLEVTATLGSDLHADGTTTASPTRLRDPGGR